MATPLSGVPIPDPSEAPANFSAGIQAAFEHSETFDNLRFADASDRDAKITAPVNGQVSWLDSPGRFEYYRGGEWVPEGRPAQGQVTLQHSSRPTNDRSVTNISETQIGSAVEFPVPPWATDGGSSVKITTQLNAKIAGPARFTVQLEYSFDAGASWSGSQLSAVESDDNWEGTATVSIGNDNINVSVPTGTTTVRARLMVTRTSGTGSMELSTSRTLFLWLTSFYHSSTPVAVTL